MNEINGANKIIKYKDYMLFIQIINGTRKQSLFDIVFLQTHDNEDMANVLIIDLFTNNYINQFGCINVVFHVCEVFHELNFPSNISQVMWAI